MCTLIGTSTNLVVDGMILDAGYKGFGMFELGRVGIFIALTQFINSHLKITPEMKATGKQGRVIYSFNVDIDGSMKDFRLVRGLDPLMDAEALRVLQLVNERWSTGYYFNSKKWYREFYVNQFTIPIIFSW